MFIPVRPCNFVSIALFLVLSVAACAAHAKVLYVTNTGVDQLTCGTVQAPCRSISQTIANATVGDTLLVGPGRYGDINEDGDFDDPGDEAGTVDESGFVSLITVDKQLTLLSQAGASRTVLDGGNRVHWVVKITASQVTVGGRGHGFTIRNGRYGDDTDIGAGLRVDSNANNVTLTGNLVQDNTAAGFWIQGNGHLITYNTARRNRTGEAGRGFQITGDGHTIAYNNSIESGGEEGSGFFVVGDDILFFRNKTADNVGPGIEIRGSGLLVISNEAKRSEHFGFAGGGTNAVFQDNVADSNYMGFVVGGTNAIVRENIAKNSIEAGFFIAGGKGKVFTHNVSVHNAEGFLINGGTNLQFTRNTVLNNYRVGFSVEGGSKVLIRQNVIKGNRESGIDTISTGVTISQNNIQGNGHYKGASGVIKNCGVRNRSGGIVPAKNNFWGASTGPGPNPADRICNYPGSTTLFHPFARNPFTIP